VTSEPRPSTIYARLALVCAVNGDLVLPQVTFKAWMALVYMGIFGTAIAFAMLLLGETLEMSMVAGAVLVIAGVFIINKPDRAAAVSCATAQ
jgi:drug/metabolite transporter (DMT)-like permease